MAGGSNTTANRGIAYQLWSAIQHERVAHGWSHVDMAAHLGLPRGTIARLKTSPYPPKASTVRQIADRLGIDVNAAAHMAGLFGARDRTVEDLADEIAAVIEQADIPVEKREEMARQLMRRLESMVDTWRDEASGS